MLFNEKFIEVLDTVLVLKCMNDSLKFYVMRKKATISTLTQILESIFVLCTIVEVCRKTNFEAIK